MTLTLTRRSLGLGTAGFATLGLMRGVIAEAATAGGTWLDMVKAHHALIAGTFDRILATANGDAAGRATLLKQLGYQLTAHSVAEENVLYPALARLGMSGPSDQLYIEQAHAKVGHADLAAMPMGDAAWLAKVAELKTAVLHHAKDEEEGDLFPKLMKAVSAAQNAAMTKGYAREFGRVAKV